MPNSSAPTIRRLIDPRGRRTREILGAQWRAQSSRHEIGRCRHDQRAQHDEGEARVPIAGDVEKAEYLAGLIMCETVSPRPNRRPLMQAR